MVNRHEQSYVSRMSYVLNENSDLLPLNSHILSLGMQYVKKNETESFSQGHSLKLAIEPEIGDTLLACCLEFLIGKDTLLT